MILKPFLPDRTESDISVHKNGAFTFRTDLVSRYKLDEKNLSIHLDQEDKDNKYIYLAADPLNKNGASFKIAKNSGGSYQKMLKRLALILCAGAIKCQLLFTKSVTYAGGGYMQFEVIREEEAKIIRPAYSKGEKALRGPRGPYKKHQVDHE